MVAYLPNQLFACEYTTMKIKYITPKCIMLMCVNASIPNQMNRKKKKKEMIIRDRCKNIQSLWKHTIHINNNHYMHNALRLKNPTM